MSKISKFKKSAIVIPAAVLLVAVSSIGTASAAGEDFSRKMPQHAERGLHLEIKSAIASGDYEAFQNLIADAPFTVDVDEETFAKMVEAHTLMEDGDIEGTHEIMDELGFPMRGPHGQRDDANFKPGEGREFDDLTDDQKIVLENARALREDGEFDQAHDLVEEADIEMPMHRGGRR